MPNKNPQLNTILLVILIILVGILLFMMWNRNGREKVEDEKVQNAVVDVTDTNIISNTNNKLTYKSSYGSFLYENTAKEIPSNGRGVVNIGTNIDDPFMENVSYFSDTNQVDPTEGLGLLFLQNLVINNKNFESYVHNESGSRIYIYRKNDKAVSVVIPYRVGGNVTSKYVDLGSLEINQSGKLINTVTLDLTNPYARTYQAILAQALEMPADFNGHYKVASIGCGTGCFTYAVIDKNTGKVYKSPQGNDYGNYILPSGWKSYSLESNLIKIITNNGSQIMTYSFDGTNFTLVSTVNI